VRNPRKQHRPDDDAWRTHTDCPDDAAHKRPEQARIAHDAEEDDCEDEHRRHWRDGSDPIDDVSADVRPQAACDARHNGDHNERHER
jgi:hypothetical protein